MFFSNLSFAELQCLHLLDASRLRTTEVLQELNAVYRGETEISRDFWNESVEVLVVAIDHYSFSDINRGVLTQIRDYLNSIEKGPLTSREKLLLSIIEFNIRDTNGTEHIDRAIETLRSINVPVRRAPEYNWHLAQFYYALGEKQKAFDLLTYIINTARIQPKTHLYYNLLYNELGSPQLSEQTIRALGRSAYRISPQRINRYNWGPYTRVNN